MKQTHSSEARTHQARAGKQGMMETVKDQVVELKALWRNKRALAFQALNLAMIVFSALMIWKSLMVYTNSESPVVVVLTGRYVG